MGWIAYWWTRPRPDFFQNINYLSSDVSQSAITLLSQTQCFVPAKKISRCDAHQACQSLSYRQCEFNKGPAHFYNWSTKCHFPFQPSLLKATDCSFSVMQSWFPGHWYFNSFLNVPGYAWQKRLVEYDKEEQLRKTFTILSKSTVREFWY